MSSKKRIRFRVVGVRFIRTVLERLNLTGYAAGKWLNIPPQLIHHALTKGSSINLKTLCKWRYISGFTWNQMGKLLDEEFLDGKDIRQLEENRPARKE
jgi:hypothetical protein